MCKHNAVTLFKFCTSLCFRANGDGEIRTLDPLLARQVLSQLSYTPTVFLLWMRAFPFQAIPFSFPQLKLSLKQWA